MPSERWLAVEQLFAEALAQPPDLRASFLERTCGTDRGLRLEVGTLLTASDQATDFLAAPALEVFAREISQGGWSVQAGDRIGSYRIDCRIGAGGTGEVWRARDDRLGRDVAIKLLLPHPSNASERLRAFQDEARAAGSLNHVNVLTVHDVGEHHGAPYLVTECLDGESLRARLGAAPPGLDAALDIALQVAKGLGAAHARGIVHRDLKPENIFLVADGRVKILDFGLASLQEAGSQPPVAGDGGMLMAGTAGYMAPEQVRGEPVDQRADIFALGAILYELLAGRRPFAAPTVLGTLEAVLTRDPPPLSQLNPHVPPDLAGIVQRSLAKAPEERFPSVAALVSALEETAQARNLAPAPTLLAVLRRPSVALTAAIVSLGIAAGVWRGNVAATHARWARTIAAPEIQRLANQGDFGGAFLLARKALDDLPDDPHLKQLWLDVSVPAVIETDPAGVDVSLAPYKGTTAASLYLGRTPLKHVRIPRALVRVRLSKPGWEPIEASMALPVVRYRLDPVDKIPPGMVRVVSDPDRIPSGLLGAPDDYWIDRFEITNGQFKQFIDAGGYRRRAYWREPFTSDGRVLAWEEAVQRFHDRTGLPGPATWAKGTYPVGQADFPVGGVSWYEAAAYAVFAGKALPTVHHWYAAAGSERFADILTVSNFSGTGPAAVGSYKGLGPFGTYDMAGNVKEWSSTETNGRRFLLGGGWNEPRYMFADYDAKPPFERAPTDGFRLVRYERPLPARITAPVPLDGLGNTGTREPVGDDIYEVYRRAYAYDRSPLNAALESTETTDLFVKHIVVFDAAYGGERMRAYLFLPKNARPPYQAVVFFPAGDAFHLMSSHDMSLTWIDFVVRSGRAFVYPIYKGTYERQVPAGTGWNAERDLRIAWVRDLGRAIDYLETRPDIDRSRLGFFGVSAGGDAGVMLAALEPRLKTAVIQGTGIGEDFPPEIDAVTFAPRVRIPVLMLNGRYDFVMPYQTAQRPLFDLLGSPAGDKRHAVFETGHALPVEQVTREILPWLDRYLGPVAR